MPLRLTVILAGASTPHTLERSPARIGRGSSNDLVLADAKASKEHAELLEGPEGWTLRDLGSRNGTRVNGEPLKGPRLLRDGDVIAIGDATLRVGDGESNATMMSASFDPRATEMPSLSMDVRTMLRSSTGATRGERQTLALLTEAGQMLVLPRPLRATCEDVLALCARAATADRFVLLLRESAGADLVPMASRIVHGDPAAALVLSRTIVRRVLDDNTAVVTSDATSDPRFMGQQSIVAAEIHSAMAVPLFDNTTVLGLLYLDTRSPLVQYGAEQLEVMTLLANMAAVKITNARLLEAEAERQRLEQEAATARRIQGGLLPEAPHDMPGWSCLARLEPCHEVAGDLYDFHRRPDGTWVVLGGDVSGKGMGAALYMSSMLSAARVLYDVCDDPLTLVQRLNQAMQRSSDGRSFVTMFVGHLDPATGRLRYVNAGHPEPHLVHGTSLRTLPATGIPVGMLPDFPWQEQEVVIAPGESLAIFSDGIPEAQHGDAFFDLERVADSLRRHGADGSLEALAQGLLADIDAFAAGEHRADDVTLLVLRRD